MENGSHLFPSEDIDPSPSVLQALFAANLPFDRWNSRIIGYIYVDKVDLNVRGCVNLDSKSISFVTNLIIGITGPRNRPTIYPIITLWDSLIL